MDVQVENLDTHEARITISIPEDVVSQTRRDLARKLSKQVRIPGFRPGNAPLSVIIGAIGEQAFMSELADELGSKFYAKAIEQANIDPYGPGQLEDFKDSPMQLIVRVPLEPTVDIKDYKSVRVPYTPATVSDEDVDEQLRYIREDNAIVELVERPAQVSDLVEADIIVTADGQELMHNHRPVILDAERLNLPGLLDAIVGMSAGEDKETAIVIPDDFANEALRGKEASASISIKRVSSRILPEVNDELAQTVGSFTTIAELRDDLRTRLVEYRSRTVDQQYGMQALDTFTNLSTVVYPNAYIEDRLNDMVEELKEEVKRDEKIPFEDWLKLQGKTEQQVRDDMRPNAELSARRGLVMREIARAENVDVSDAEVAAEVERMTAMYGERGNSVRRALMSEQSRRSMHNNILSAKVMARITQLARGEVAEDKAEASAGEAVAESQADSNETPTEI